MHKQVELVTSQNIPVKKAKSSAFKMLHAWAHVKNVAHESLDYILVVPHKAVAEVSKIGYYRRGEWL